MDFVNDRMNRSGSVWWIRLDFEDFRPIDAPPRVRKTFDEGFTLLHELRHTFCYRDTSSTGEPGECEKILNQVREEIGLPLRSEYFPTSIRMLESDTALIRLRFHDGLSGRREQREHELVFALSMLAPSTSTASVQRRQ